MGTVRRYFEKGKRATNCTRDTFLYGLLSGTDGELRGGQKEKNEEEAAEKVKSGRKREKMGRSRERKRENVEKVRSNLCVGR